MKLTLFKGKAPTTSPARTVSGVQESFAAKLGALRKATGRPERFVSHCACARHDQPFMVVYERNDPTKPFTIAGIHKGGEAVNGDAPKGSMTLSRAIAPRKSVPASDLDTTGWRCPHCGCAGHVIACDRCGTTVCGGRTVSGPGMESVFNCRPSCNARGTLTNCTVVHGVDGAPKVAPRLPAPGRRTPALPSADRLRLKGPR